MKTVQDDAMENLDMEFVLSHEGQDYKVAWGRSGRQLNLRTCPFCGNDKYKTYMNADNGMGNCFAGSCTQGTFNKAQFLRALYDVSWRDLGIKVAHLAAMQGWRPKTAAPTKFDPGPLDLPPNTRCTDLPAMPRYLMDRGIDLSTASHFDLRYCDVGQFKVADPTGKIVIQDYSKRIIIPIYNLAGDLVSFQGRDATGTSEKRYLFPPMYSSTGSQLYNINNWRDGMDTVVIAEGPFDAIGVHRTLSKYALRTTLATASFGMSFSESKQQDDQINRLLELKARGLRTVCFMWDNESPAIKAAIAAALKVSRYGLQAKVAVLSRSKDPGEAPPEEIKAALDQAHPVGSELQAMLLARKIAQ